jgi:predicted transcriptional regulator
MSQRYNTNGRTHVALLIAKHFGKPFTIDDMQKISALFVDRKLASKALNTLRNWGFVAKLDDSWCITREGVEHLYTTAKTYASRD